MPPGASGPRRAPQIGLVALRVGDAHEFGAEGGGKFSTHSTRWRLVPREVVSNADEAREDVADGCKGGHGRRRLADWERSRH